MPHRTPREILDLLGDSRADMALGLTHDMIGGHEAERDTLDDIRLYWTGRQRLPGVIPREAPNEIRQMARMARVNIISVIVESLTQSLIVDGVRDTNGENVEAWSKWQANKMDRAQLGITRAATAYGTSYVGVFDQGDVWRGYSPRRCYATYADDPDWPYAVLIRGDGLWTLFDEANRYVLAKDRVQSDSLVIVEAEPHGFDVPPFVRFRDVEDLDLDDEAEDRRGGSGGRADHPVDHVAGQVAPMIALQDQIDVTTFDTLATQHYGAFRQKAVVGWEPADAKEVLQAAANRLWTFEGDPDDIDFHEFTETDMTGYLESRQASMKHAAALSQTPAHEITSNLVNLSADALVAAEAGRNRKVQERQIGYGESWEQVFRLASNDDFPDDAEVTWRETSSRAFAATVDALGKMAKMLGVPQDQIWPMIPNTTQQQVQRWRDAAEEGETLMGFADMLSADVEDEDDPEVEPDGTE